MSRVLLSAQILSPGGGGICCVARMTALAMSRRFFVKALACQDLDDHCIGPVAVRAFRDHRFRFVVSNLVEVKRATHVFYDFAGTARAHLGQLNARRPYAVWIHGWEVWRDPPAKYIRAISGASLILVNSEYTRERAGRTIPSGARVKVCALGTPEDDPPDSVPADGPPTVLLVGRVDELFAKGHEILIEVWPKVVAAVPDARLLMVGGGSALDKLRALASASPVGQSIEVAGFVRDQLLDANWRRATVFAMLGFAEGFGLVYVDAMRYGVPVIASTDDGGQEVNVDGVTGFNVARTDKLRLVEVLVALLRDRDYARSLGRAGQSRWKAHYTFSAFSERLMAATSDFLQQTKSET